MLWHVGVSGKHECLRHYAASLRSRRTCRPPRPYRSSKLLLQALQPAENVRVSLAVPSISVVPTDADSVEATVKEESPVKGGQSSKEEDQTTDVQENKRLQSRPNASKPAPRIPGSVVESREFTRDRRHTLPSKSKIVESSSQRDAGLVEERTGSGMEASTSEREIAPEVKDDLGGNVSADKGKIAGNSSSHDNKAKYAEEKVSLNCRQMIWHVC